MPLRLVIIGLALFLMGGLIAQAAPARNVGLLSFDATAQGNTAVRLEWETATELNLAGFIVKRSVNDGPFVSLPDIGEPGFVDAAGDPAGFVAGEGGPAEGATYAEMDNDVEEGNRYIYKLLEVENDFTEVELDTDTVVVGEVATATATATPTTTSGSTATNTPTTQATSSLNNVSTATPTSQNTATATADSATGNNNSAVATATATQRPVFSLSPTATPTAPPLPTLSSEQNSGGVTTTVFDTNSVLAQTEPTATSELPATTAVEGENGYPVASPTSETPVEIIVETPTAAALEIESYPPASAEDETTDSVATAVPLIGSQANNGAAETADTAQESSVAANRGRLYLWLGFLLSLLIFITTIVATILLFTRKRTQ